MIAVIIFLGTITSPRNETVDCPPSLKIPSVRDLQFNAILGSLLRKESVTWKSFVNVKFGSNTDRFAYKLEINESDDIEDAILTQSLI